MAAVNSASSGVLLQSHSLLLHAVGEKGGSGRVFASADVSKLTVSDSCTWDASHNHDHMVAGLSCRQFIVLLLWDILGYILVRATALDMCCALARIFIL
jgi:hypothetical protein